MPASERERMRATINLPGLGVGEAALVDPDDAYVKLCVERGYLVAADAHGKMSAPSRPTDTEPTVPDPDAIQHDPLPSDPEGVDADESDADTVVPEGFEPGSEKDGS